MNRKRILMVGDSEHDANLLYALGMLVAEPVIYLRLDGEVTVVVEDLIAQRIREELRQSRILTRQYCERKALPLKSNVTQTARIVQFLLRQRRIKKIQVPPNFPLHLAQELRRLQIKVKTEKGPLFPERAVKTADEIKKISAALMMAEVGLAEGIQALKTSRAGKTGVLQFHNVPLTVDKLRSIMDVAILQAGGVAHRTAVACGPQSADPRDAGTGVLRANQPIIIDIFPRSKKTGYFGHITRTVVKGRAKEFVRKMYGAVARAQAVASAKLRDAVSGREVHECVRGYMESEGFRTSKNHGQPHGLLRQVGHGLGLEACEEPWLGPDSSDVLRAGQIVTVEPGLYYPRIGGVRLEDVMVVTHRVPHNLTAFEKILEI